MNSFDVFNGDADGICALQQMRLAYPADTQLVSGIKRDIQLVKKVDAKPGDKLLVLDVSLDKNIEAVKLLLKRDCQVQYFDHHLASDIPDNDLFKSYINTSADMCTSLLVNEYLKQRHVLWAITGAYGDNMLASAERLAEQAGLDEQQRSLLHELGIYLNYNGYGASLEDLYFTPTDLYLAIKPYNSPFEFIKNEPVFEILKAGYKHDMAQADSLLPAVLTDSVAVYILPAEKWCRRVSGVLANNLSNQFPDRAHAILTKSEKEAYQVSVRAPHNNKTGAGELCSQFESGGGRQGAAGINHLPEADKERFVAAFSRCYSA